VRRIRDSEEEGLWRLRATRQLGFGTLVLLLHSDGCTGIRIFRLPKLYKNTPTSKADTAMPGKSAG